MALVVYRILAICIYFAMHSSRRRVWRNSSGLHFNQRHATSNHGGHMGCNGTELLDVYCAYFGVARDVDLHSDGGSFSGWICLCGQRGTLFGILVEIVIANIVLFFAASGWLRWILIRLLLSVMLIGGVYFLIGEGLSSRVKLLYEETIKSAGFVINDTEGPIEINPSLTKNESQCGTCPLLLGERIQLLALDLVVISLRPHL